MLKRIAIILFAFVIFILIISAANANTTQAATVFVPTSTVEPTVTALPSYMKPNLSKGMHIKNATRNVTKLRPFKIVKKKVETWDKINKVIKWKIDPSFASTSTPGRFNKGAIVTVWYGVEPKAPKCYHDSKDGVERWRPLVRWELKKQGVWSKYIEDKIVHWCILVESHGNPTSTSPSGNHHGISQFNTSWRLLPSDRVCSNMKHDHLHCGRWAIYRIVRGYKMFGESFLDKHWELYPL